MLRHRLLRLTVCVPAFALATSACDVLSSGPETPPIQEVPAPPEGFPVFEDITVGTFGGCGRTADSVTSCWGLPLVDGALAMFVPTPLPLPKLVDLARGLPSLGFRELLCGRTGTADVICYGEAAGGQVTVPGATGWTDVVVGGVSCALDGAGAAHCWPYTQRAGLLGLPPGDTTTLFPGTPVTVQTAERFVALSANANHTCGLTATGEAWCWGSDFGYAIGSGGNGDPVLLPAQVATGETLAEISAGELHTCALTTDGRALCWGYAHRGVLGRLNEPTVPCPYIVFLDASPAPCIALPGVVAGGHTFTSITAGSYHTCGLDTNNRAWCWGSGSWGEIGTGRSGINNFLTFPQAVLGDLRFRSLEAGQFFTCGIAEDDATYCWGANSAGQLGAGRSPTYVATVPHPVGTP